MIIYGSRTIQCTYVLSSIAHCTIAATWLAIVETLRRDAGARAAGRMRPSQGAIETNFGLPRASEGAYSVPPASSAARSRAGTGAALRVQRGGSGAGPGQEGPQRPAEGPRPSENPNTRRSEARHLFALYQLISPLVLASCVATASAASSSGRIFLASALPSSTPHWSKELMPQMMPWQKILCSYMATRAPRVRGSSCSNMIELVGLLPSKTLCGSRKLILSSASPEAASSARASSGVLPFMSASVCAKKLDMRIGWWSPTGFWVLAGARKSEGMSLVPWCMSW
mmetsp:Transcript_13495/g.39839  ORF Transcript_13495/g.39839 Transcript_13495/m.39839 type:complete len:284 (-) Transcript_13495:1217-2068(-)